MARGGPLQEVVERDPLLGVECAEHLVLELRERGLGLAEPRGAGVGQADEMTPAVLRRARAGDEAVRLEVVGQPDEVRAVDVQRGGERLLGGRDLLVLAAPGGGYGPGTPRHGWDHAEPWLPHGLSLTGLQPRFIVAELTLADVNPAMADLRGPAAARAWRSAEREIDEQWGAAVAA